MVRRHRDDGEVVEEDRELGMAVAEHALLDRERSTGEGLCLVAALPVIGDRGEVDEGARDLVVSGPELALEGLQGPVEERFGFAVASTAVEDRRERGTVGGDVEVVVAEECGALSSCAPVPRGSGLVAKVAGSRS